MVAILSRGRWVNMCPTGPSETVLFNCHDDVIKCKHFPRYWPFVRGIHRSPVNSPHKGQWREDLMFSLIYAWINGWVNNREAGDLRRHRTHYDVTLMGVMHRGEWSHFTYSDIKVCHQFYEYTENKFTAPHHVWMPTVSNIGKLYDQSCSINDSVNDWGSVMVDSTRLVIKTYQVNSTVILCVFHRVIR